MNLKTFEVYRAQSFPGKAVPHVALCIDQELPDAGVSAEWEQQATSLYERQAKLVHEALQSLPQGTKHQLLILLLQEKVELYQGP